MAKYAHNGLRMHLLQSRISKFSGGGGGGSQVLPHLHLRRSVHASGTQLSPYFIN